MRSLRQVLWCGVIALVLPFAATGAPIQTKTTAPRGLALVPGDASAFLHVNVAALKGDPTFQLARKSFGADLPPILTDVGAEEIGVPLSNIEGFTLVGNFGSGSFSIVTVEKPYDRKAVLGAYFRRGQVPRTHVHRGKTVYAWSYRYERKPVDRDKDPDEGPGDEGPGEPPRRQPPREAELDPYAATVYFLNERTLIYGNARSVTAFIDRAAKAPVKGPLSVMVEQVARTKHHFCVGIHVPLMVRQELDQSLRRMARREPITAAVMHNLKPLLRLESGTAMASLGEQTHLKFRVQYGSAAIAKNAKESTQFGVMMLKGMLGVLGSEIESELGITLDPASKSKTVALWSALEQSLEKASIKQEGSELSIEIAASTPQQLVREAAVEIIPRLQQLALRKAGMNNLRQVSIAMHNFTSARGKMPLTSWIRNEGTRAQGSAGLSWRVAILPYVEHKELYDKFKRDEPWDSEHNKKLIAEMPKIFAPPGVKTKTPGLTHYRVFAGPLTPFNDAQPSRLYNMRDGTSNTFMVIEAKDPVIWTKPDELQYDPKKPLPKLGGVFSEGFHVAMCDGSVRFIKTKLPEELLRGYVTANGGERVPYLQGEHDDGFHDHGERAVPYNGPTQKHDTKPAPPLDRDLPPVGDPKPIPIPPDKPVDDDD